MKDELESAWAMLNWCCQSVTMANTENLSERIAKMENARFVYDKLLLEEMRNKIKDDAL